MSCAGMSGRGDAGGCACHPRGRSQRTLADRLLDRVHSFARRGAELGRHYRGLRGAGSRCARRDDVAYMKGHGRKVMISLGGGGQHFTLADPKRVPNFVDSVQRIVSEYGFDGIDIDFESPSLSIEPGDTDLRNPKTPSIVNLIS